MQADLPHREAPFATGRYKLWAVWGERDSSDAMAVMGKPFLHDRAGVHVPDDNGPVLGGGCYPFIVGGKDDRPDEPFMPCGVWSVCTMS